MHFLKGNPSNSPYIYYLLPPKWVPFHDPWKISQKKLNMKTISIAAVEHLVQIDNCEPRTTGTTIAPARMSQEVRIKG